MNSMNCMNAPANPKCPDCGFAVFNRRCPKCERCGAQLPSGIVYSTEERLALQEKEYLEDVARRAEEGRRSSNGAASDSALIGWFGTGSDGSCSGSDSSGNCE